MISKMNKERVNTYLMNDRHGDEALTQEEIDELNKNNPELMQYVLEFINFYEGVKLWTQYNDGKKNMVKDKYIKHIQKIEMELNDLKIFKQD